MSERAAVPAARPDDEYLMRDPTRIRRRTRPATRPARCAARATR